MKNKRAVVLLSGGLDSATVLYLAREKGYTVTCLIFDYGQRHRREIEAAKKIASGAGCPYIVEKIRLNNDTSALLNKGRKVPCYHAGRNIPSTYVPARNIIFLSYALFFAESLKAQAIFIGAHAQDYSGYPDCRPEFLKAFERAAQLGTAFGAKGGIRIAAPLVNKGKAEIINIGMRLKVPYQLTWSCYKGGRAPCGRCDSCYYRAKGFKEAGVRDPAL